MKSILTTLFSLSICFVSFSQNCGNITDFTADITDLGGGLSQYTFHVTMSATSGGSKSVQFDIACPNNIFVPTVGVDTCVASEATVKNFSMGPYTRPTCTGTVNLTWSGHSNAACGGTTCSAEQSLALPVELMSFRADRTGDKIKLEWSTATEINNEKFIIERSADGRTYQPIGEVVGNGTTFEQKDYSFVDAEPQHGLNHYRLKQIDFDGGFEYSKIVAINLNLEGNSISLFPNPVKDYLNLKFSDSKSDFHEGHMEIIIRSTSGKIIKQIESKTVTQSIDLEDIPSGIYILEAQFGGNYFIQKIAKQ